MYIYIFRYVYTNLPTNLPLKRISYSLSPKLILKNHWLPSGSWEWKRVHIPLPFSGTFEADDVIGLPNPSASLEGRDVFSIAKTAKSLNVF